MESIISTDLFDAFRTEDGILINEKGNSAKKFGMVVILVGAAFFLIGFFINVEAFVPGWIASLFRGVFLYGGILLLALGLMLLIVKGLLGKAASSTIYKDRKEMDIRGKIIPFSEVEEISLMTTPMPMGKQMTVFLYIHKGKKKPLISGSAFTEDTVGMSEFMKEVEALVGVEVKDI